MKEFDLELAKQGHPVCTRNGRPVRIICFDSNNKYYPIVALVTDINTLEECVEIYSNNGKYIFDDDRLNDLDLMMASQKYEGWINLYKTKDSFKPFVGHQIFNSKKEAKNTNVCTDIDTKYVATIKIEWEE